MRWALLPRISLPTGVRRRRPITISSASLRLGDADQVLGRLEAAHQLADLVVEPGLLEPGLERGQVALGLDRGVVVELPAAAMGVDHDQRGVAQPRLGDALLDRGLALGLRHVSHDHRSHGPSLCSAGVRRRSRPSGRIRATYPTPAPRVPATACGGGRRRRSPRAGWPDAGAARPAPRPRPAAAARGGARPRHHRAPPPRSRRCSTSAPPAARP